VGSVLWVFPLSVAGLVVFAVIATVVKRRKFEARPTSERHLTYKQWSQKQGYGDTLIQ
jgi:cytochrome c-type biogenesis protein CcmH/NrfF